uniref:peroxidasin-like isoform X1 n=1 Tax=Styela clava TaxID=7725 RepID=UPI001939B2FA|nr:peroxidasin-like isoform X1 [Styela clava]
MEIPKTVLVALLLASIVFVEINGQRVHSHRRQHHACPEGCLCLITGTTVRCMHRRFTKIPRIPTETRILDLRFNHIRDITPDAFQNLKNLHTLLMNNNQIRRVPANAFKDMPELKHLYLYKNRVDEIDTNAFSGLNSLEQLYLYNNDISTLEVGTLSNLPNLERLFLHNNVLTTLPEGLFDGLSSLKRLRLDNNQLMCDCKLLWFARMLLSLGGNIQATVTCNAPRHLFGRSISTIPLREFKCTAPAIVTEPHSTQVREGETIYMSCTASGSPQPHIVWYHDGEVVPSDARRRQSIGGSLIIMNPKKVDEGLYKCVATNTIGSAESRQVQVVYRGSTSGPPFFISRPQDVQVRVGEPTTLECRAAGTPEPTISWIKDGNPVNSQNALIITSSGSLHFRRTETSDNGSYTCIATNDEGSVNTTAEVIVRSPPVFTQRPEDLMVLQGDSALFQCHFTGNPSPTITWLKNGRRLPRDQRYLVMSSGTLLIRVVNPGDEGKYTCRLYNLVGTAESHADLSVRVAPHFIVRPQNQRVRQGRTVDFQCQASGIPQPHIVWTVNGRAIPDDDRYSILPSGTLRILRVETRDAGVFTCEAANPLGARKAEITLEVIPFQSIQFTRTPSDLNVDSGSRIRIPCHVQTEDDDGLNSLTISWAKDSVGIVSSDERYSISPPPNSYLTIMDVGQDDAGRYECIARSGPTSARASMTLTVTVRSSTEEIVSKLLDILPPGCLQQGCSHFDENDVTHRPDELNQETLNNLLRTELGIGTNFRQKRQTTSFNSRLNELSSTVNLVTQNIDGAINNTIHHFNDRRQRQSSSDLLALMRFPSTRRGVNMMRAAEVFEVSLHMIECCIRRGAKLKRFALDNNKFPDSPVTTPPIAAVEVQSRTVNAEDDSEQEVIPVIGTEVVAIVANLSGCSAHQKIPDCSSNICFHRKYRTSDGTCNNLQHPMWGASLTPFHRILKPIYENGFNAPVGWDSNKLYHGRTLPSPRRVSIEVLMSREPRPSTDADFTHMTMQWGQFIDHDLDFTTMAPSIKRFSDGVACKDSCDHDAPCFPIEVNPNDPRHRTFHHHATHHSHRGSNTLDGATTTCMEFTRSSAVCGSGITSVFFSALSRREQINQITSYQDASNVYGSTDEETKNLRDLTSDLGLLKEGQPLEPGQKPLLPYNVYSDLDSDSSVIRPVAPIECRRGDSESPQERSVPCFLCGDHRCNEQISLTSMHTLWMREHNRIARKLKQLNKNWNGETIFNEARKIVGAEMQHITYSHWLPKILGPYQKRIGEFKMYNPNSPSSIVNVFATAAFRFGHTMINPIMFRLNQTWGEHDHGNLMLHQAFFAPYRIIHEGGIDPLIRGLIAKPMKARDSDSNMNSELIERLFALAEEVALDLGALNIQRGRDHALPFYNEWREFCNSTRARTFDDLAGEITNQQVRQQLQNVYGNPENIDPFVGMILEDITSGSRLGPTLGCLISEQFMRIRDGDRLWYENPGVFSPVQLTEIRQSSLAKIICDNTDGISSVPRDVFRNTPISDFVSCQEIPAVDLRAWTECCDTCSGSEETDANTLSAHIRRNNRRSKRSVDIDENGIDSKNRKSEKRARKNRKGKVRSFLKTMQPVTLNDKRKIFNDLVWSQRLQGISNPKEMLDISQTIARESEDAMEQTLKDLAMHNIDIGNFAAKKESFFTNSDKKENEVGMDKLLNVIENLESRISDLQSEVKRLSGKVDNDLPK